MHKQITHLLFIVFFTVIVFNLLLHCLAAYEIIYSEAMLFKNPFYTFSFV